MENKKRSLRKPVKFQANKATGGLCWYCDRRLYAGGRSYVIVEIDGILRPVHQLCHNAAANS